LQDDGKQIGPLPSVHDPHSQSAFIKTRNIHENFLYVKNTIKVLHAKTIPFLFFQVGYCVRLRFGLMGIYVGADGKVGV
jgi:hypothetical protein